MSQVKHFVLQPAKFRLDGGAMFGIIPRPMWSKVAPPDEQNRIDLALRLWLIKDGDRVILTDTGIGDYHGEKFDQRFDVRGPHAPLEAALKSLQLTPEDVTDLVISHLHFDHVGGICKLENEKLQPVFPNATVHLHKRHYEYANNPSDRDSGSFHVNFFGPILNYYLQQNKIHWLDGEQGTILEFSNKQCLNFIVSHGHTPYLLHAHDDHFIYLADIIPTSHHVHIPWVMAYDINPGISTQDKKRILQFIQQKKLTILFEHDPQYIGATIKCDNKSRYVVDQLLPATEKEAFEITQ